MNQDHRVTYSRFYGDDILEVGLSEEFENYDNPAEYDQGSSAFDINWPWGNKTNSLTWRWLISPKLVARTFIANSRYRFNFDMGFLDTGFYSRIDEENQKIETGH